MLYIEKCGWQTVEAAPPCRWMMEAANPCKWMMEAASRAIAIWGTEGPARCHKVSRVHGRLDISVVWLEYSAIVLRQVYAGSADIVHGGPTDAAGDFLTLCHASSTVVAHCCIPHRGKTSNLSELMMEAANPCQWMMEAATPGRADLSEQLQMVLMYNR